MINKKRRVITIAVVAAILQRMRMKKVNQTQVIQTLKMFPNPWANPIYQTKNLRNKGIKRFLLIILKWALSTQLISTIMLILQTTNMISKESHLMAMVQVKISQWLSKVMITQVWAVVQVTVNTQPHLMERSKHKLDKDLIKIMFKIIQTLNSTE
jgi:hypothetical protein